jgi:hypothetical protein
VHHLALVDRLEAHHLALLHADLGGSEAHLVRHLDPHHARRRFRIGRPAECCFLLAGVRAMVLSQCGSREHHR